MLVAARKSAGITQAKIAKGMARPQSYVSKYERGERRLDFTEFVELAELLGIDIPEFLNRYHEAISAKKF